MDLDMAMKDPARTFASPEAVESSGQLSAAQKRALLLQWKNQVEQLLVASEENMPGPETSSGINADCLRRIVDALARLEPRVRA